MYCRTCRSAVPDTESNCSSCGKQALDGTLYCQHCGAKTNKTQHKCQECGGLLITNTRDPDVYFASLSSYYQKEFHEIYSSGGSYKGKFNACAFLFGTIWALTKRCWLAAILYVLASIITLGVFYMLIGFIFGLRANYFYYRSYIKRKNIV